jgi:hypothetical protein
MQKWLILVPMSSQLPSSLTIQKKLIVMTSPIAMTIMNRALGATPNCLFSIPRLAERTAKGTKILNMSSAPCDQGSNTGTSRETASSEKEDIEAMLPVGHLLE